MASVDLPNVKITSPKLPSVKIKTETDKRKNTLLAMKRRLTKTT